MTRPFLKAFLACLLLLAAGAAAGLWYAQRRLSRLLEAALRERVFKDPERASFEAAGVSLLRGAAFIRGLRLSGRTAAGTSWKGTIDEVLVRVSLRRLAGGEPPVEGVRVLRPDFEALPQAGQETPPQSEPAPSPSRLPTLLVGLGHLPIREVALEDGRFRLLSPWGGRALAWEKTQARLARGGGEVEVRAAGRLEGEDSGFSVEARLADLSDPCESEGQLRIERLPVPRLAAYFPSDPDLAFKSGRLSLNTQFNCKKDWLTASHLVEVRDFLVEVPAGTKKLFGVKVKYLQDLLRIEQLSFVVPMNGSVGDPHIGISASLQQIILKMAEGKFEDKEDAEALARRGGDYFGRKLDRALKAWQKGRR